VRSIIYIIFISLLLYSQILSGQSIPVELVQTSVGDWQLLRDGKPYYIKGAGGEGSKELLAASGANTFRTWENYVN